jgi:cytochrome c-type biogenesis protein CcmF
MALMGIAPLSAWGRSTFTTLGRLLWKPSIPTVLALAAMVAFGVRNWIALVGFTLVAFVIFVTMFEICHEVRSRKKGRGENLFLAFWRLLGSNRRRYGGYIIHISMVVMAVGILGVELYQTTTQKTLATGDDLQISGYTLRYDSLTHIPNADGSSLTSAVVSVFRGGRLLGELHPQFATYPSGETATVVGIYSTLADDVYVVLIDWENASPAQAPFKVIHNPLINWLWIGSLMFIIGILIAAGPEPEKEDLRSMR